MKDKIIHNLENQIAFTFETAGISSVLVAVSGGADSVALLCGCSRIAPRFGLRVEAANCNFHLRGAESDRDSDFTTALCKRLGVRLHQLEYDVHQYMEEHPGVSAEMACRELRYADFFRICRDERLERVAVAHNVDDDIETMILALLRGSGTRGLRGMDADNGRVIRPLLGIDRSEIEAYLAEIGQDFVTDSSNLTSDYRRNFIRRDIIPLLEGRWPGVRKSLSRTLSIMKEEASIVDSHYLQQNKDLTPDPYTLFVYADGVTTGTILRFIESFGGNSAIAGEIMGSLGKEFGERRWKLSERYTAALERDRLIIMDNEVVSPEPTLIWEKLDMTPELMSEIKNNRSHDIIYLPHDESDYVFRFPLPADRISPLGMKGTRLVSDVVSDARLDSNRKALIRVLTRRSDGEIIWVTGLKRSRKDLVDSTFPFIYRVINKTEP